MHLAARQWDLLHGLNDENLVYLVDRKDLTVVIRD